MKISIGTRISKNQSLIIFVFENESVPCNLPQHKSLVEQAKSEGFKAKENSTVVLHPRSGSPAQQVILVGLGDKKNLNGETLRRASATAIKKVLSLSQNSVSILSPDILNDIQKEVYAVSEGALLGGYKFDKYITTNKESKEIKETVLIVSEKNVSEAKKGLHLAKILSDATCFVRDLVNEPPSDLTPAKFSEFAKSTAEEGKSAGVTVTIFDKEQIEEMQMGALLGVNRGSAEPPVLIHLHYKPENSKKSIALVGKGITFDSGGLSLKPSDGMETMKMDMAGAASILGVFKALPYLKPQVEVHGILALTENMPGGRAYKPGDILKTMSGKTIEVLNTDAEGRLILADALSYAQKQNPDAIIDVATLTGAVVIALGSLVAGVMGNDDDLFKGIQEASENSGEKFWQLPLVEEYRERLKSSVADIQNISSVRREAGPITGGLFLQAFVKNKSWLHIDIAGPAWADKEFCYLSKGGTGFPTRTLIHYLLNF